MSSEPCLVTSDAGFTDPPAPSRANGGADGYSETVLGRLLNRASYATEKLVAADGADRDAELQLIRRIAEATIGYDQAAGPAGGVTSKPRP
ncbi:hypothetical protein NOF55_21075 [Rhizobiaceae bacterium BDR2-2]|uniref:Uncharacterized protein n=1 Tax=Ectorhizobium quercum TaxID=2965071 RepID=A0AAE3N6T4_9HYPH|nr:hypothetical protein [Ectorhizobium quercum]MCX8999602.1 hypothetical protein [Ectorhizobium quercum]